MSKSPFDLFIDLIIFDQDLHKKEKEIIALESEVELLEDHLEYGKKQIEKDKLSLHDMRKDVDMQELDMKTLDEKGKKIQERFALASNNKEYLALKKESEESQIEQMAAEEKLISIWTNLENAQKAIVTKEKEYQTQKDLLESQTAEKQKEIDALEAVLQAETKSRQGKESGIPEEWLEKYARMRNTVADPVAAVEDKSCKACFHAITNQEMAYLKRKRLLQCKGCYRFLYISYSDDAEEDNG
jgi:predicted  nucleic acid-binding Zn-ribbon protein